MEFLIQDLSGRGFTCIINENDIPDFQKYFEDYLEDETLEDWSLSSIVGDKLEANAIRITRTK